jgi:trk/ktr system potassium uptake protein
MNLRLIARNLGLLQLIMALSMSGALAWCLVTGDGDHWAILISMAIASLVGLVLMILGRHATDEFYRREALAIVGLGWTLSAIIGALPFVFSGLLGPIDAFFESMSGLTTTGSTVIRDINGTLTGENALHGVMFWRSFLHWLGGMGIVVLLLALLPAVGAGTKFLFQTEAPGPTAEGLKPRIRQTAMRLWVLYVGLSVVEFILLWAFGMTVYESMCHTFGTMATGGFSTENGSIAAFASIKIEVVIIVFMFLAGTSFNLHYHVAKGRVLSWFRDPEWRVFTLLFVGVTLLIAADLRLRGPESIAGESFGTLLRWASFTTLSIGTTTGFCTADFDLWPASSKALLIVMMFIGGCAGSTGGGMKVLRVMLLLRIAGHQLRRIFNPRRVYTLRVGARPVDDEVQQTVLAYFLILILIFVTATMAMSALIQDDDGNAEIVTAATSVAATLNNIGPGLAAVGATQTYADIPPLGKLILSFCMVAGRLELWAILCLFVPGFWRAR